MSTTPTISVRGVGRASATPDRAIISFHISAINHAYSESIEELNERVATLRKNLEKAGIQGTDLKTASFNIQPEHEYRGKADDKRAVFVGWRSRHNMRLDLPMDRELINMAFGAIASDDVESTFSVGFEVRDVETLRDKLLDTATRMARRNAETIATAAGCRLGKVQNVNYGWSEIHVHTPMYELAEGARTAPDFAPEDVKAEDSVTMVFELLS